jgi:predicted ATP-grasp superfamily ATP-dependent carboligase
MLVFLYEYTCAVADPGIAPSLRAEGRAMLSAVSQDFARLPGVKACNLLASGLGFTVSDAHPNYLDHDEESTFRLLAAQADFTLVIAPETNDLLLTRCRWVLDAGGRLLGPGPEAVGLTADKLTLAGHFLEQGIRTPRTLPLSWPPPEGLPFPAVIKPRFGAGSQGTFLVRNPGEGRMAADQARKEMIQAELVIQPLVAGRPASVAFLLGRTESVPLVPVEQLLSDDGRFRYLGGRIPLAPELCMRAQALAGRALAGVAGLQGYVGVDLILGPDEDGSGDHVLEINPRLTTSYIGLRHLARENLAARMVCAVQGMPQGPMSWEQSRVRFSADGSIVREP